jgi:preprotein translocase subunit SecA
MTGTADTEAVEFDKIYSLEVVVIPPNRPMVRKDNQDVVYRTERRKWHGVVEEIADCQKRVQPALVGTISIEKSETLSTLLKRKGIKHVVLNAKYHEMEAEFVAQAGRVGRGDDRDQHGRRGTDILLGGNPEFLARQQLHLRGLKPSETPIEEWNAAYEAALVEMREQCRNEHGRGHPGGRSSHSRDGEARVAAHRQSAARPCRPPGRPWIVAVFPLLGRRSHADLRRRSIEKRDAEARHEENVPIESGMVSRAIERAQKQVEQRNFETRNTFWSTTTSTTSSARRSTGCAASCSRGRTRRNT